jgi:hypothetical protein
MPRYLTLEKASENSIIIMQKRIQDLIDRDKSGKSLKTWDERLESEIRARHPGKPKEVVDIIFREEKSLDRAVRFAPLTLFDVKSTETLLAFAFPEIENFDDELLSFVADSLPTKGLFEYTYFIEPDADVKSGLDIKSHIDHSLSAKDGFAKVALILTEERIQYQICRDMPRPVSPLLAAQRMIDKNGFDLMSTLQIGDCCLRRDTRELCSSMDLGDRYDPKTVGFLMLFMSMTLAYLNHFSKMEGVMTAVDVAPVNRQSSSGRIRIPGFRQVTVDLGNMKPQKEIARMVKEAVRRGGIRQHEVSLHWRHFGGDLICQHQFEAVDAEDGIARQKCVKCDMRRTKIRPFRRGNPELGLAIKVTKVTDTRRK